EVALAAVTPEQHRLVGPILADMDRAVAALDPLAGAFAQLTPLEAVTGAVSTFADITRFKQMEGHLRVREAWFSTTLRSIADAVIATDHLGRIEFMNAVAER